MVAGGACRQKSIGLVPVSIDSPNNEGHGDGGDRRLDLRHCLWRLRPVRWLGLVSKGRPRREEHVWVVVDGVRLMIGLKTARKFQKSPSRKCVASSDCGHEKGRSYRMRLIGVRKQLESLQWQWKPDEQTSSSVVTAAPLVVVIGMIQ